MATNKAQTVKPVDKLSGTIHGNRFTVVLDGITLGDIWASEMPGILQKDGLGKAEIEEGAVRFIFKDAVKSTIAFTPEEGHLKISAFSITTDGKEEA